MLIAALLASTLSVATVPVVDRLTDKQLWEQSDLIAVVRVHGGDFDEEQYDFDVSATVVALLKGDAKEQVKFVDSSPWQYPERLGGYYLVHLTKSEQGYLSVETGSSVIELTYGDPEYPDEVKKLAAQKGAPEGAIIKYKNYIWVISVCLNGDPGCRDLVPVVKQAFNKQRQGDA